MHLAIPLVPRDPLAPLMAISFGRVSTPHQPLENIDASHRVTETFLKAAYKGPINMKRLGEQASGMKADRPSIREARKDMEAGLVDLIIAEDLSRIYRNPRHQMAFVQDCVDAKVRLIALADNLDTFSPDWELQLSVAALRHGLIIPDTRRRVNRTATHSFHSGGMVQKVKYGYRKLSKEEALSGRFGPPHLRMAKLPDCTPTIMQMRAWFLDRAEYVDIAEWLNLSAIRAGAYVKNGRWTAALVKSLLSDEILAGIRTFRDFTSQIVYRTGDFTQQKNVQPEKEYHECLAHMTPAEFDELKAAIKLREQQNGAGKQNGKRQIRRRDAVWPAQHARCDTCGDQMHRYDKDQLKCRNAFCRDASQCWNHVQVRCDLVRERFITYLVGFLDSEPGARAALVDTAWVHISESLNRSSMNLANADAEIEAAESDVATYLKAMRMKSGRKLASLVNALADAEARLMRAKHRKEVRLHAYDSPVSSLDRDTIDRNLKNVLLWLARTSPEFAALLRTAMPSFIIQPVQALDCPLVRPRGIFRLNFSRLLAATSEPAEGDVSEEIEVVLDLFEPPIHIRVMEDCVQLKQKNPRLSLKKIASKVGTSHMTVKRALAYHRLMDAEGLSEPYRVLTTPPARASRWRPRARRQVPKDLKLFHRNDRQACESAA